MNAPENNPPFTGSVQTGTFKKKSHRRIVIVLLVCLIGCSGLLVPAIRAAREAERCGTCAYHLKQIGIGLHCFNTANGSLPPAYLCDEKGKPIHSWRALLMPYIGHYGWRSRKGYSLKEPWDGPDNSRVHSWSFSEFQCPSVDVDNPPRMTVDYVAVVGPDTMWPGRQRVALAGGNQDTILLLEMPDSDYRCLEPRSPTVDEFMAKIKSPTGKGIRCIHPSGLAYVTVGGEVRRFPSDTDPETIRKSLKRDPNCQVISAQEKIPIIEGWEQKENESK